MLQRPFIFFLLVPLSLALSSCRTGSGDSESSEGCGTEGCKIVAPDADRLDTFGFATATDGDKIVIGSIVDEPETDAGAAYVFIEDDGDWTLEQKIQATTPVPRGGDLFGGAVAIQGNRIAVSAQGADWVDPGAVLPDRPRAGRVYIFEFDGTDWTQVQAIEAFDPATDDFFGVSLAMDGDWLVVGSYLDDDNGNASGSVYVYEHDGADYVFDQKLNMTQNSSNDRFGFSVAIDGDVIVAGAHFDNFFFVGIEAGSAAVFRHDGTDWNEEQVLLGGTFAAFDQFGISVDIEGDIIVIGAHQYDDAEFDDDDDDGDDNQGIVWVIRRVRPTTDAAPWASSGLGDMIEAIEPSDPELQKLFGGSVAIDDGRVIVGVKLDDELGQRAGAAYVYEHDGTEWAELHKLTAPDATTGDQFGASTAMAGDIAVVGANLAGPGNDDSGAAYAFEP